MHRLKPSADIGGEKLWESRLSSETPTLMPDLKFHNLVFGRDLGVGSFSTVRYARVVRPGGKTFLSQWDEVAVKVISFDIIKKHGYGENILREICCLRQLGHPSIARLISSFKWRDGIYMVLEYGSFGDLHSYIRRNGPILSMSQVRVILGEIATALLTVHESGFVYGDLKPENIVITATRHIKLADFGACRPVTRDAMDMLVQSRDALLKMRSGDWKPPTSSNIECGGDLDDEHILNPKTFEGTTVYLSPEVIANVGSGPTYLSDAWAFGMTMYFIMFGRLPAWSADITSGVGHFNVADAILKDGNIFESATDSHSLIISLLELDSSKRSTIAEIMNHPFFDEDQDIRKLYKRQLGDDHLPGVSSDTSAGGGGNESQWEKRQLSKIWTSQPIDYALSVSFSSNNASDCHEPGHCSSMTETNLEKNSPFIVL